MGFQITVKKAGTSLNELFAQGQRYDTEKLPFSVGSQECDCPLPDVTKRLFDITEDGRNLNLEPAVDAEIFVNKVAVTSKTKLSNGDHIEVAGHILRIYRTYGRPGVSRTCSILAYLSVGCAIFFFLLYIGAIVAFPLLIKHSSSWNAYLERQIISRTINQVRGHLKASDTEDPLNRALNTCFAEEINSQARYFLRNYDKLNPRQRRTMLEELNTIKESQRAVIKRKNFTEDFNDDINGIIEKILNK